MAAWWQSYRPVPVRPFMNCPDGATIRFDATGWDPTAQDVRPRETEHPDPSLDDRATRDTELSIDRVEGSSDAWCSAFEHDKQFTAGRAARELTPSSRGRTRVS